MTKTLTVAVFLNPDADANVVCLGLDRLRPTFIQRLENEGLSVRHGEMPRPELGSVKRLNYIVIEVEDGLQEQVETVVSNTGITAEIDAREGINYCCTMRQV